MLTQCTIPDCERPHEGRGLCRHHYQQARRRGSLEQHPKRSPVSLADRLRDNTLLTPNCWLWTGYRNRQGYGQITIKREVHPVHRVMYEWVVGPIPEGLECDHLCHGADTSCKGGNDCPHRRCVNPKHLETVTPTENKHRGVHARKTHCPRGHLYDEINTYVSKGSRFCRTCQRAAEQRWYWKRKAQSS